MPISTNKQAPVTYIRVEKYLHPFVRYKYGEFPVELPVCCRLYDIFSAGLVPNYESRNICYSTCSAKKYAADRESGDLRPVHEKMVPFVMPDKVLFGGVARETNAWFQLSRKSYKVFIAQLKNEFWSLFMDFNERFRINCARLGEKYTCRYAFDQFLIKVGIDTVYLDTIYRDWRRKKKELERYARFVETLD